MNNEFNNETSNDLDKNLNSDSNNNLNNDLHKNLNSNSNNNLNNDLNNGMNENINHENINHENQTYQFTSEATLDENKKKKKLRSKFGFGKVVAAALIFGLVSGSVFQGISYVSYQAYKSKTSEEANAVDIVNSENTSEDEIPIPVSYVEGGVISDVSNIVENAMPFIVAINVTVNMRGSDFFGREITQEQGGSGSGFIIAQNNSELLIATNNHVVEGATTVEIVFADDTKAQANLKGSDVTTDLAVVSVNLDQLSDETLDTIKVATVGDSSKVKAGEMAIAIGNALGYGQSVTVGYISALNREVTVDNRTMSLLQTDAAINQGNSGGALINTYGEVIGINTMKYVSSGVEGMGYAIPISDAIPMIEELMNRESIAESEQGFLGIVRNSAQDVTELYAQRFNMPLGVYINEVVPGSPAEEAGLKQSDIITGIKNTTIKTIEDLVGALSYIKAGETVNIKVHSIDETGSYVERDISVTLDKRQ